MLTTLGLELPTDPRWVNIAEMNIGEILIDHAFCEQKAASSCISLIVQYPEKEKLVEVLTPVVAEEWGHFQRVLKELRKRNIPLSHKRRDEYVHALQSQSRKSGDYLEQLMEKLLLNALIEARSNFIELAEEYCGKERVWNRWKELLDLEAQIMQTLEVRGDRMH